MTRSSQKFAVASFHRSENGNRLRHIAGPAGRWPFGTKRGGRSALRNEFAGTPHLPWQISLLRQPIAHRQNRFLVIYVQCRFKCQGRYYGCIYIDKLPRRMLGEQVTSASPAPFADAE